MAKPASSSIQYLFRYRDLVAKTLEEHQKIIKSKGACWWGWWKRPTEDDRMQIWNSLKRNATKAKPVLIGLFNSGTGKVNFAEVIEVILPRGKGNDDLHPIVPEEEQALVPPYYRNSPFSMAWMKLRKIEKEEESLFGEYSFAEAPILPNYSKFVLDRLKDKVIKEPEELRGMDTTIWVVRKKRNTDSSGSMLLTLPGIPHAISSEAISAKGKSILHITDLHFALGSHRKQHVWRLEGEKGSQFSLAEAITAALKNESIGAVVVTGDLTFLGSEAEFTAARQGLFKLLGILDLGPEHLIVIPGNHDIVWRNGGSYTDGADVRSASEKATKNYRKFYADLFRHDANAHLSMGRRYIFPSGVVVEIAAVNSSSLETGKKFLAGMGRVQEAALQELINGLNWNEGGNTVALRILALHHHLALTENIEPAEGYSRGFGIAVDAPRIQRMAVKNGVQLALHGHKHRSFVWRSTVYELLEDTASKYRLGDVSILGGGSAGSSETDGKKNFFNVIEVDADGIKVRVFKSSGSGVFQQMTKLVGNLSYDHHSSRLVLKDWSVSMAEA